MRKIKSHTLQKLEYFKKYLEAYLRATQKLPKKYYIDAFAGSGECILTKADQKVKGSSLIALTATNPFDAYLLIEKRKKIYDGLKASIKKYNIAPDRLKTIKPLNVDSNEWLPKHCHEFDQNSGYLIFLDPEGPELHWDLVNCLYRFKKADVLILYPYDMSLVRLVKDYKDKLDKFYGSPDWLKIYNDRKNAADARGKLLNFYIKNLKKLGFAYVIHRQIKTQLREGRPLYYLILATHHWAGEKIMKDVFDKELDGQTKMKLYT